LDGRNSMSHSHRIAFFATRQERADRSAIGGTRTNGSAFDTRRSSLIFASQYAIDLAQGRRRL
jgi:hypothetical protein